MAAAKKGRRSPGADGYPGRALAIILVALVALASAMFISNNKTPRLGIDLAGGTEITLTAKNNPGQPNSINKTNMNTAADIIGKRVNGLGVSEAGVQTQGSKNIVVDIPKGTNTQQAEKLVGTTAQLYFRPVITLAAGSPQPATTPSPSTSGKATPSGAPSASTSGKPAPGSTAKPTATPSASATTQGRAVTSALQAAPATGSSGAPTAPAITAPTPAATATGAATPPPSTGSGTTVAPDPKAEAAFTALNCSNKKQAANAGYGAKPTDQIAVCSQDGSTKYLLAPVAVSGKDVSSAQSVYDTQTGAGWIVTLGFDSTGNSQFAKVTGQLASQQAPNNEFAIVLDNQVVSSPSVSSAITGGSAQISGSFTQQSSEDLANVLSYGALPLSFNISTVTTVSPQLGGEQLHGGLIAGAVGLVLVVLYLLAYYRGLSFIAVLSLVVSAALTYAIMALLGAAIGFALSLPAVCGAIVAIGITADSFIVYFERVRDELRHGRSLGPAVQRAWPRARRTILVSDFVSFLAAAVLYICSVGDVKGFAFTLGLTTVLDVVVVYLFTKPLLTILARRPFYSDGHKWSGLNPESVGFNAPLRRVRRQARTEVKEA
ncbi:protein translocase subunit SecD [Streptomyces sp. SL13]|uniref:Protein translocase subunit SecD n=1 Tax=Streptantibioticus silvisoli TaxID=2705255 RepID=A0AA90H2F0_9ACTN|nr:protein translocase subunit SecD [Streptantibioticus silvisoli]MDI5964671.1 protein translocase subunit SecD [Streptantibioticus silvisoli]MDI5972144.1 protein translocase subunit SecD [Streptantibioticus silvisoli]